MNKHLLTITLILTGCTQSTAPLDMPVASSEARAGGVSSAVVLPGNQSAPEQPTSAADAKDDVETYVDRAISERVRLALQNEAATAREAAGVSVVTKDGVVRLSGAVSSEAIKQRMTILAKAVGSVVRVDDQLRVAGG